jgi:hypothetical protein
MKNILSIIILTFLFVSCNQRQSEKLSYALADREGEFIPVTQQGDMNSTSPLPPVNNQDVIKKKIIKDGQLRIQVADLENSKSRIDTLVKNHGGYYDKESFNNTDRESTYHLKIRVPFANFEILINDIETGKGELKYKEIDARDVTDQFIDLETRLQNKKNYLKRYNELLAKAQTVKDILEIEEKIRGIEEEIESTTGRLNYLSDLVEYSSLDLTISKSKDFKYNPVNRDNFIEKLKQALFKGWFGLIDFMLFFINLWPFWIIVTIIYYLWKKWKRNKK